MVALAKKRGDMAIEFSELYDQEDDIYCVTFKAGEPSYVVELDDVLSRILTIPSSTSCSLTVRSLSESATGQLI